MTKLKITNRTAFEMLINELQANEGAELVFAMEDMPTSYPCVAIHHYSYDVDFGSIYNIELVYLNDFHPCLKTINLI